MLPAYTYPTPTAKNARKGWAEKSARLEGALASAEAALEERGRETRLLAASLQDARGGLAAEEAARREAEGRAEALRYKNKRSYRYYDTKSSTF